MKSESDDLFDDATEESVPILRRSSKSLYVEKEEVVPVLRRFHSDPQHYDDVDASETENLIRISTLERINHKCKKVAAFETEKLIGIRSDFSKRDTFERINHRCKKVALLLCFFLTLLAAGYFFFFGSNVSSIKTEDGKMNGLEEPIELPYSLVDERLTTLNNTVNNNNNNSNSATTITVSALSSYGYISGSYYRASYTNSARRNTVDSVSFDACAGASIRISGSCSGDQYLRLFKKSGNTVTEIAADDDRNWPGDVCSEINYVVPGTTYWSYYSNRVEGCSTGGAYFVRQGCYENEYCSGRVSVRREIVSVSVPARNVATSAPTASPTSSVSSNCASFSTSNTASATQNNHICRYYMCPGDRISAGGTCTGDTYFRLTRDAAYGGYGGYDVREDDDSGPGTCASLSYTVPSNWGCNNYYLDLGCYRSNSCGGYPNVSVTRAPRPTRQAPTARPTARPSRPPSAIPTVSPSRPPSAKPTARPSRFPSVRPTVQPTTIAPTSPPTQLPTREPSAVPSIDSATPTNSPARVCSPFSASNTASAKQNNDVCEFKMCAGDVMTAGGSCTGDTYFRLTRNAAYGKRGALEVAADDDSGPDSCAAFTYTAGNTGNSGCKQYYLNLGCFGGRSCSGIPEVNIVRYTATATPTFFPSSPPSQMPSLETRAPTVGETAVPSSPSPPSQMPSLRTSDRIRTRAPTIYIAGGGGDQDQDQDQDQNQDTVSAPSPTMSPSNNNNGGGDGVQQSLGVSESEEGGVSSSVVIIIIVSGLVLLFAGVYFKWKRQRQEDERANTIRNLQFDGIASNHPAPSAPPILAANININILDTESGGTSGVQRLIPATCTSAGDTVIGRAIEQGFETILNYQQQSLIQPCGFCKIEESTHLNVACGHTICSGCAISPDVLTLGKCHLNLCKVKYASRDPFLRTYMDDLVTCGVCWELMDTVATSPVALKPCGHVFCTKCSTELAKCPNCRSNKTGLTCTVKKN